MTKNPTACPSPRQKPTLMTVDLKLSVWQLKLTMEKPSGTQEAIVAGLFSFSDEVLENPDKFKGSEILLKRELSTTGRNRVYINGELSSVGLLADLSRGLISISGQHEHQLFLEPDAHLELIDRFGGLDHERKSYARAFGELRQLLAEIRRLRRQALERREKEELSRFQLNEIDKAKLHLQ